MQRRYDFDSLPWHLVEVPPGAGTQLARWNAVILSLLGLLILGLWIVAVIPHPNTLNSNAAAASQSQSAQKPVKRIIQPPRGS
jgi:hypothetical protein